MSASNAIPLPNKPYVAIDNLKRRIDYDAEEIIGEQEHNREKRFDELLGGSDFVDSPEFGTDFAGLEAEARGMINTRTGNQTFHLQEERVDTRRTRDNATLELPYPVNSISKVERLVLKGTQETFEEIETRRYTSDRHHLILRSQFGSTSPRSRTGPRANPLTNNADRWTWRDVTEEVRVTYSRGYESIPAEVRNVVVRLVNQMCRNLAMEQGIAAASPDQMRPIIDASSVVTEDIEKDIQDLTPSINPVYTV